MRTRGLLSLWINFRFKKELLSFLPFFILFWLWFYQIQYKNIDTKKYETSLFLSGFIAVFPAAILSSLVVLVLSNRVSQWLKPMMKLVVILAKTDGKISIKDRKAIEKNLNRQYNYFRIQKAISYFNEFEKDTNMNIVAPCKQLNTFFGKSEMTVFLNFLVSIAISDQYLSLKEEKMLKDICFKLGVSNNSLFLILERRSFIFESKSKSRTRTKPKHINSNKAYLILGLDSNATISEVKKAYRKLAKLYHPDKVRDKKLKESATLQFQAVSDAYESIKKEKG